MPELEGRTFGNYHLIEKAGRGGMSNVYKAQDLVNDRIVAVKILAPHLNLDEKFKSRFIREAQVLSQLDHPNIIPVIDYGEVDGLLFFVMPYMKYGGLHLRMQKKPMNVKEAMRIVDQICSALQYAHDRGVVHRDVKPSNILLDDEGNCYLSDFGFAHVDEASVSLTGSAVIGTPAYMAPEQLQEGEVTPLSDQYALGVVLYRMSTGYLPFDAETPIAIALKHATEPLPRPRYLNPNLPEPIERVLIKALSKDPSKRYPTISDFNQAFHQAIREAVARIRNGITDEIPTEAFHVPLESTVRVGEKSPTGGERKDEKEPWYRRRAVLVVALLLLLLCPLSIIGTNALFPDLFGGDRGVVIAAAETIDVQATLNAFATEMVALEGDALSEEEIRAMLDATLTAQASATPAAGGESAVTDSGTEDPLAASATEDLTTTATLTSTSSSGGGPAVPSATPTRTQTSASTPPAGTTPTSTLTAGPTSTPTPTLTLTLTATATTPPTNTPTATQPPTNTPTATQNVCDSLSLSGKSVNHKIVSWNFNNNSSSSVTINYVALSWPGDDNILKFIKVGGSNNPVNDPDSPSSAPVSVSVAAGGSILLQFQFESNGQATSYSVTVNTTYGCSLH
ncbi:MAG: serine/threonine-protein kinase [Anaerolineales bacterium]|jgi:tRNA A-37 threonylcarbamoyl transferase component Bud32